MIGSVERRADSLHSQDPLDTFGAVWSPAGKNPIMAQAIEADAIAEAGRVAMVEPGRTVLWLRGHQPSRARR